MAQAIIRHQTGERPAWPSVARLSKLTGYSVRSVQYALRGLERKSALTRWERVGGRGRTPFYRIAQKQGLLFSSANVLSESCGNHEKGAKVAPIPPEKGAKVAPRSPGSTEVRKKDSALARGELTHEWRQQQKARRILREIDGLREVYAGAHGNDLVRRDYRLGLLYAELETTEWQDARAG